MDCSIVCEPNPNEPPEGAHIEVTAFTIVPEPNTLWLLAAALAFLKRRRS
jgi:hypothetical protein